MKQLSNCTLEEWNEAGKNGQTLVIVESPAKAKTIAKFLGSKTDYIIDFCAGHIRQLASNNKGIEPDLKKKIIDKSISLHVGDIGVDVFDGFQPIYVPSDERADIISRLKKTSMSASRILLATDEDREGEAISWHIVEVLQPKVPYKRAVFHEITKKAIEESFKNPRDIDTNLVQSQETRRILDRLTGFTISPVLWRYIESGLSAGRVQSCGLHLITEREKLRWQFVESKYYTITAHFGTVPSLKDPSYDPAMSSEANPKLIFSADLVNVDGCKVANEKDFNEVTGEIKESRTKTKTNNQVIVLDESKATAIMKQLSTKADSDDSILIQKVQLRPVFTIQDIEIRQLIRKPPLPYITSSLQQDASKQLQFSPSRTMALAQNLYESGYITYMRTDSPILSEVALNASKAAVLNQFGEKYIMTEKASTTSKTKAPKNAQEAHEAIRPAELNGQFKTPWKLVEVEDDAWKLYAMVYRRTLASIMKPAQLVSRSLVIEGSLPSNTLTGIQLINHNSEGSPVETVVFRCSETIRLFDGFMILSDMYRNRKGVEMIEKTKIKRESMFEKLVIGQQIWIQDSNPTQTPLSPEGDDELDDEGSDRTTDDVQRNNKNDTLSWDYPGFEATSHTTRASPRFTEAGFIKQLEELGVGRPSTYSKILQILKERAYIMVDKQTIVPTIKGMMVASLLEKHFKEFVEHHLTAEMELTLDQIAHGQAVKEEFLEKFYLGSNYHDESNTTHSNESIGLLPRVVQKIIGKEIDHKISRSLEVPYLKDLGMICLSRYGAYFESHGIERIKNNSSNLEMKKNKDLEALYASEEFQAAGAFRWKLPDNMQQDIRLLTRQAIENLMINGTSIKGSDIGFLPGTNDTVIVKTGRFGKYLQVGKDQTFSIPEWVDENTSKEDLALFTKMPMEIGIHPIWNHSVDLYVQSKQLCVGIRGYPLRCLVHGNAVPSAVTLDYAIKCLPNNFTDIQASLQMLGEWKGYTIYLKKSMKSFYIQCGDVIIYRFGKKDPATIPVEKIIEMLERSKIKVKSSKSATAAKKSSVVSEKVKPKRRSKKLSVSDNSTEIIASMNENIEIKPLIPIKPKRQSKKLVNDNLQIIAPAQSLISSLDSKIQLDGITIAEIAKKPRTRTKKLQIEKNVIDITSA